MGLLYGVCTVVCVCACVCLCVLHLPFLCWAQCLSPKSREKSKQGTTCDHHIPDPGFPQPLTPIPASLQTSPAAVFNTSFQQPSQSVSPPQAWRGAARAPLCRQVPGAGQKGAQMQARAPAGPPSPHVREARGLSESSLYLRPAIFFSSVCIFPFHFLCPQTLNSLSWAPSLSLLLFLFSFVFPLFFSLLFCLFLCLSLSFLFLCLHFTFLFVFFHPCSLPLPLPPPSPTLSSLCPSMWVFSSPPATLLFCLSICLPPGPIHSFSPASPGKMPPAHSSSTLPGLCRKPASSLMRLHE